MKWILCLALVFTYSRYVHGSDAKLGINTYLQHRYSGKRAIAFYDEKLSVVQKPVDIPELRRVLPLTNFYCAKLRGNTFEYREVAVLIARMRTGMQISYQSCLSPDYSDVRAAFLTTFAGIRANSRPHRQQIAQAITQLLASVLHEGRVGRVYQQGMTNRAELWTGDQMWRQVRVTFGPDLSVKSVQLINLVTPHR